MVDLPERLRKRITVDPEKGCWLWSGAKNSCGYGSIRLGGHLVSAHRLIFELLIGPIPAGTELHHKCEVHHCCNPSHLSILTYTEHQSRHIRRSANGEKMHCPHGHPYDERNTWLEWRKGRPVRHCRICNKQGAHLRRMKSHANHGGPSS